MPDYNREVKRKHKKLNHRIPIILGLLLLLAGLLAFLCLSPLAYEKVTSTFFNIVTEHIQDIQSFFAEEKASSVEIPASSNSTISSDIVSSSPAALSSNSVPQTVVSQSSTPLYLASSSSSSTVSQESITAEENANIDPERNSLLEQLMNACEKEDTETIRKIASSQSFLQLITEWCECMPSSNLFYGDMQDGKGINIKLHRSIVKISHTESHTTYSSKEIIETQQTILNILYGHWHDNEVQGKVLNYQGYVDVCHTDNSPFRSWEKNYPLSWSVCQFNVLHENIASSASAYSYTKRMSYDYTIQQLRGTIDSEGYWHGTVECEYTSATNQESESEEFNHGYYTTPEQENRRHEPVFRMSLYKDLLNTSNSSAWNDYVRNKISSSSTTTTSIFTDTSLGTVTTPISEYTSSQNISPELEKYFQLLLEKFETGDPLAVHSVFLNPTFISLFRETIILNLTDNNNNFRDGSYFLYFYSNQINKGISFDIRAYRSDSYRDNNKIRIVVSCVYGTNNGRNTDGDYYLYDGDLQGDRSIIWQWATFTRKDGKFVGDVVLSDYDDERLCFYKSGPVDENGYWHGNIYDSFVQSTEFYEHGNAQSNSSRESSFMEYEFIRKMFNK